jgi:hypothetical protein
VTGVFTSPLEIAGVSSGGLAGGAWPGLPKPFPGFPVTGNIIMFALVDAGGSSISANNNISSGLPCSAAGLPASGKPVVLAYAATGVSAIPAKTIIGCTAENDFSKIVFFTIPMPFDLHVFVYEVIQL